MKKSSIRISFMILTIMLGSTRPAWANVAPSFNDGCETALVTSQSLKLIPTNFDPPVNKHGISSKYLVPNLSHFIDFTANGEHALIRHQVFPTGEHVSIVNTQSGQLIGGLTWDSQQPYFGQFWSAALSDDLSQLIIWGGNQRADGIDRLVTWQLGQSKPEQTPLTPLDGSNSASKIARYMTFRSQISAEHPYYLRSHYSHSDESSKRGEFVAEIGNHQTGKTLKINDIYFDSISQPLRLFQTRNRFVAIPSRNNRTVNIMSFDELEHKMNSAAGDTPIDSEFKPLIHDDLVRRVVPVKHAPLVVTSTQHQLSVWNALTGQRISQLNVRSPEFVVFDHLMVIAYKTNEGQLALYSYLSNQIVGLFEKAPELSVSAMVDEWQNGLAYVTDKEGRVFQVAEKLEGRQAQYEVKDTGLVISHNEVHRTVIRGTDDFYFITASAQARPDTLITKDLVVKIYSWSSQKLVAAKNYAGDGDLVIKMDTSRRRIFFTASKREIGFLDLDKLLLELGL